MQESMKDNSEDEQEKQTLTIMISKWQICWTVDEYHIVLLGF